MRTSERAQIGWVSQFDTSKAPHVLDKPIKQAKYQQNGLKSPYMGPIPLNMWVGQRPLKVFYKPI